MRGLNDTRKFMPEIEGLRAVAATLVMVYHVYLGRVSGGVDVFFLVAGFLITGSLLRQVERTGRISPGEFLSRLARRLLPGALFVLTIVLVAARILLPVTQRAATYREIIASALYYENWALASKSVDYLARDEPQSPVQHFWAMSIQGQFYILWLLVFAAVLIFGRQYFRRNLVILLVALFAGSLAFSIHLTAADQALAYFHTGTRMWEFAAGGLFAIARSRLRRIDEPLRVLGGWAGLTVIVLLGLLVPVADAFPGYIALVPVAGALLVLISGSSESPWAVSRLLGSKPLVYLGGISYALYLWHWPALSFYLLKTQRETARPLDGVVVMAVSVALAILTTRYIEAPMRRQRRQAVHVPVMVRAWRPLVVGATAVAVLATSSSALLTRHESTLASESTIEVGTADHPGAIAREPAFVDEAGADVAPVPSPEQVSNSRRAHAEAGCHQDLKTSDLIRCEHGEAGDVNIMLVGGSHSAHWRDALDLVVEEHGWQLTTLTKSGCLFTTETNGTGEEADSCREWNTLATEDVIRMQPDLVVMTSTRGRGDEEHVPRGYLERWAELEDAGVDVLAIRDNPRSRTDWVECLARNWDAPSACDQPRADLLAEHDPSTALEPAPPNVHFADLSDYFCDDDVCSAVIGNVTVYRDAHHLTDEYAATMAPVVDREIMTALEGVDRG